MTLPTGKAHVSFSEVKSWSECSFRHFLQQVKKIDLDTPSTNLSFGSATHAACEHYLKTKQIDLTTAKKILDDDWEKFGEFPDFIKTDRTKLLENIGLIMLDLVQFLDETFPGWTLHEAEEALYENLEPFFEKHKDVNFKGYVDAILKIPGKKEGEFVYWVIDFKTANRPWMREKVQDKMVRSQVVLYKRFWSEKHNIPIKSIRCGFVTLLKTGKPGTRCRLIPVSAGDTTIKHSLKVLDNSISSIKKGISIKNRNSCTYCVYRGTEHCP